MELTKCTKNRTMASLNPGEKLLNVSVGFPKQGRGQCLWPSMTHNTSNSRPISSTMCWLPPSARQRVYDSKHIQHTKSVNVEQKRKANTLETTQRMVRW